MRFWIFLAIKNLLRHKRRTALVGISMLFSTFTMIMVHSWGKGMVSQMQENIIFGNFCDIQIFSSEYKKTKGEGDTETFLNRPKLTKELLVKNPEKIIAFLKKYNTVDDFLCRVNTKAMLGNSQGRKILNVFGIDPLEENKLLKTIQCDELNLNENEIVLSQDVARDLNINVGDHIELVMQDIKGKTFSNRMLLKNVFLNTAPWYSLTAYVNKKYLQKIIKIRHNQYSEIVLNVSKGEKIDDVQSVIEKTLINIGAKNKVLNWKQSGAQFLDIINGISTMFYLVYVIVFIVSAFWIMSAILIIVNERIREIGTLSAIGIDLFRICFLLLSEILVLSIVSALIGSFIAWPLVKYISSAGISAGTNKAVLFLFGGGNLKMSWSYNSFIIGCCWVTAISVLGSLFPVIKAGLKNPIDSLRGKN